MDQYLKESRKKRPLEDSSQNREDAYCKRRVLFTIFPRNLQLDMLLNLPGDDEKSRKEMNLSVEKLSNKYPVCSGKEHYAFNQNLAQLQREAHRSSRDRDRERKRDRKEKEESVFKKKPTSDAKDGKSSKPDYPGLFRGSTYVKPIPYKAFCVYDSEIEKLLYPSHDMFEYSANFVHDYNQLAFRIIRDSGWVPGRPLGKKRCQLSVLCSPDQCHSCKLHVNPVDIKFSLGKFGLGCKVERPGNGAGGSNDSTDDISNGIDNDSAFRGINRLSACSATAVLTLSEHCRSNSWGFPVYMLLNDGGPLHRKSFLYKVRVNNVDYVPHAGSSSKKQAKADAALGALYALGLLKPDNQTPAAGSA